MPEETRADLLREFDRFCRYLVRRPADARMGDYYCDAHARIPYRRGGLAPIDRLLLAVATTGSFAVLMADHYARFLAPSGALRQKLVLTTAILENSPATSRWFDTADTRPVPQLILGLAVVVTRTTLAAVLGLVLFAPAHACLALLPRTAPPAR